MTLTELQSVSRAIAESAQARVLSAMRARRQSVSYWQRDAERLRARSDRASRVTIWAQLSGHSADPSESMRPIAGGFRHRVVGPSPVFANYSVKVTR